LRVNSTSRSVLQVGGRDSRASGTQLVKRYDGKLTWTIIEWSPIKSVKDDLPKRMGKVEGEAGARGQTRVCVRMGSVATPNRCVRPSVGSAYHHDPILTWNCINVKWTRAKRVDAEVGVGIIWTPSWLTARCVVQVIDIEGAEKGWAS